MGHRSVDQMLLHLGRGIELTDEEFAQAMAARREKFNLAPGQLAAGCPLCASGLPAEEVEAPAEADAAGGEQ